jgi:hypothetical protein
MKALSHGLQASVRNNYTAYGYSIMITASFGILASQESTPGVGSIFVFLAGAVTAFVAIEAIVSKGFTRTPRGEPTKVAALGAAFSFGSVAAGVGAATLVSLALYGLAAWGVGGLVASGAYILMAGMEIAIAELMEDGGDR